MLEGMNAIKGQCVCKLAGSADSTYSSYFTVRRLPDIGYGPIYGCILKLFIQLDRILDTLFTILWTIAALRICIREITRYGKCLT